MMGPYRVTFVPWLGILLAPTLLKVRDLVWVTDTSGKTIKGEVAPAN
jgi:hypothetical protein